MAHGRTSKKRNRRRRASARRRDKYALYQRAVQEPEANCKFYERVFKKEYGRSPSLLREDFCAAGAVCCEWVRGKAHRFAVGCDLDPEPLTWGRENNVGALPDADRERVELREQDVLEVEGAKADVISAENFSYFVFHTRDELRAYFEAARGNLGDEGVLVLDIMGGSEVHEEDRQEERELEGGTIYVWEQARFDPINNLCTFYIHFRFRSGPPLERAFRYDWRLWSIPEVRELLEEAGFRRVDVYWEGTDEDGEGNGIFRVRKQAEADPAFIAYVVGVK